MKRHGSARCAKRSLSRDAAGLACEKPAKKRGRRGRQTHDLVRGLTVQLEVQLRLRSAIGPAIEGLQFIASDPPRGSLDLLDVDTHARCLTIHAGRPRRWHGREHNAPCDQSRSTLVLACKE